MAEGDQVEMDFWGFSCETGGGYRNPQQHAPEEFWYWNVPADPPDPEVVEAASGAEVSAKPPASKGADDQDR